MSQAALQVEGNRLTLSGTLDFASVPELWPQLQQQLAGGSDIELSLAGVSSSNSAALALLLEALDEAGKRGVKLRIADLPQGLSDLANLSNALELLVQS